MRIGDDNGTTTDARFSVNRFFRRSTVDCLHLHFTVLLRMSGNVVEFGIT